MSDRTPEEIRTSILEDGPEFDFTTTIEALQEWSIGGSMAPVETAISALYWLEQVPTAMNWITRHKLIEWIGNDVNNLPDDLAHATLACLCYIGRNRGPDGGGISADKLK